MVSRSTRAGQEEGMGIQLTESYRRFAQAMECFSDFEQFRSSLSKALEADPHFSTSLEMAGDPKTDGELNYVEQIFDMGTVILPLKGGAEGNFIKVSGRRDSRPFGAEDLHLMGSIAGFVSSLYAHSKAQQENLRKMEVFQFLIDQLPTGVVCFDREGALLAGNASAWQQLGLQKMPEGRDDVPVFQLLLEEEMKGQREVHFEVEGRLLFAVKRSFELSGGDSISAFVLYDMTERRERLIDLLDREYFKTRCVDGRVVVALLQCPSEAGIIFAQATQYAEALNLKEAYIQPLDAYTTAWLLPGVSQVEARSFIRTFIQESCLNSLRLTILDAFGDVDSEPARQTLKQAHENLAPQGDVLLPRLIILDPYDSVAEMLELMLEGVFKLESIADFDSVISSIMDGCHNGLIADIDALDRSQILLLKEKADAQSGFRIVFSSVRQRSMLDGSSGLEDRDVFIQKPFDAERLIEVLKHKFNLA